MLSKRQKFTRQLHELKTQVDHINRMAVEMHRCLPPCDRLYDLLFAKRDLLQPANQGVKYITIDDEFHQTVHRFLVNYGQLRKRSKQSVTEKRLRAYNRFTMLYQVMAEETSQLPLEEGEEEESIADPQQRALAQLAAASVAAAASTSGDRTSNFAAPGAIGELGISETEPLHFNRRYYCRFAGCQANFAQATTARDHVKRVHTKEPLKLFLCNEPGCNYSTDRKFSFDRHHKKHTNDRPYKCDFPTCGKMFKTPATLSDHQYTHADGQDWICTWLGCDKKFKSPNSLQNHQTRHKNGMIRSNSDGTRRCRQTKNGRGRQKERNILVKAGASNILDVGEGGSGSSPAMATNLSGMNFHIVELNHQAVHLPSGHQLFH